MHVREATPTGAVGAEGLERELVRPVQAPALAPPDRLPQRVWRAGTAPQDLCPESDPSALAAMERADELDLPMLDL